MVLHKQHVINYLNGVNVSHHTSIESTINGSRQLNLGSIMYVKCYLYIYFTPFRSLSSKEGKETTSTGPYKSKRNA